MNHTIQSLMARTVEEGNCRIWTGYSANGTVPHVYDGHKTASVRKIIHGILGKPRMYCYSSNCGNLLCVEPSHIVARSRAEHQQYMAKALQASPSNQVRIAKITATKRANGKITEDQAVLVRSHQGSREEIANEIGISKRMVSKIRSGKSWATARNPFAGLMR